MTAYVYAVKNSPLVQQEFCKLAFSSFFKAKRMLLSFPDVKNGLSDESSSRNPVTPIIRLDGAKRLPSRLALVGFKQLIL